jgi:hypothetical protein
MKKFFNIPLMMIMLAGVLATSANAQTSSTQKVTANIPFTFNVGKTTLPAGRYTITVLNGASDRKILQIRSLNGRSSATIFTIGVIGKASDDAKLVFEHYDDRYVFAQAQMAGDATGLAAIRTKDPRDKHLAKAGKKSIVVIVGG